MVIKLKNIYICEQPSFQGVAFKSDLFINNTKAGVAENHGQGGSTGYSGLTDEGKKLIREAEEWCKSLPPVVSREIIVGGEPFTIPMSLELLIEEWMAGYLRDLDAMRWRKWLEKDMEDGILFGSPPAGYSKIAFKAALPVVLNKDAGVKMVRSLIHDRILPTLREGEIILNSNIPAAVLEKLNIPADKMLPLSASREEKRRLDGRPAGPTVGSKKRSRDEGF